VSKPLFPQCKTSTGNNCSTIEDKAVTFICSKKLLAMADRMVQPEGTTPNKYMHLQVVCLRREGSLVLGCIHSALHIFVWQTKEERSSSDVNLDVVKGTAPGLPGRAYSFILIGRNVDQWRYCIDLHAHDTSLQSTFKGQS